MTFFSSLDLQPVGVAEIDTGSIMGSDNSGSPLDVHEVIPTGTYIENPTNFCIVFPDILTGGGKITAQIGQNQGNTLDMSLCDVSTGTLGISDINVSVNAGQAITKFDEAIKTVSVYRSTFGAYQNRLEHALVISDNSAENLQASESRIRDVDMAKELMEFSKTNILSQAAQAMLAQAQQQPQGVLQLLR
jgi:flagellin